MMGLHDVFHTSQPRVATVTHWLANAARTVGLGPGHPGTRGWDSRGRDRPDITVTDSDLCGISLSKIGLDSTLE